MLIKFIQDEKAVAAIEFALILPVLAFLLISLWDISHFADEKMRLEQTTRAIASNVVAEANSSNLLTLINAVIEEFYTETEEAKPMINVATECYCVSGNVDCYTSCANGTAPDRRVQISAFLIIEGSILGNRTLESILDVKIR